MIRKIIISWIAATSLILFSTQAFALLNFSVGVPLSHTFSGKYKGGDEVKSDGVNGYFIQIGCLLYTSPSPRDRSLSRMPSSA